MKKKWKYSILTMIAIVAIIVDIIWDLLLWVNAATASHGLAASMQIPIYGVDAMSESGKEGSSSSIHRVNPDGVKYTNVGKTIGKDKNRNTFNIGRNALIIWGKSSSPAE